jgi:hypothetical protein
MGINTYVALRTETVATSTPSVTFNLSGISGYTHLEIKGKYGSTVTEDYLRMQFNSDTTTNYSSRRIDGNGSSARTSGTANQNHVWLDWNSSCENALTKMTRINIFNYANTTTFKSLLIRGDRATSTTPTYTGTEAIVSMWRKSPEAITSITLTMSTGNILAGSTFSIYGIKAWDNAEPSAKATGGAVYSDSTYWYHAFPYSGTFTPTEPLTADVLVIAGGGGGALAGGGAGGVQLFSSQSISTAQSVIVGAGGGAGHCGADGTTGIRGAQGGNSAFGALTASVGGGGGGALSDTQSVRDGGAGGSGGGGGTAVNTGGGAGGANTSGQGFAGGAGYHQPGVFLSSGGAGSAGGAGANYSGGTPGVPGPGVTTYSSWGLATYTGHNVSGTVWFASGGQQTGTSTRPNGGGGIGTNYTSFNNALQATGGGGGSTYGPNNGGNGGSGVVIVRYAK